MPNRLTTEKMVRSLGTFTFVVILQAFSAKSFLLNTNESHSLPSSGQTTGSDAYTIIYLLQKVDNLQLQFYQQTKAIEEQNRTLEVQNKRIEAQTKIMETQNKTMEEQSKRIEAQNTTLEAQKSVIQELLNFTRQTPSTVSLSNDLSILEIHVRRMMEQYKKLSNTSDTKINSMANSVRVLTSLLTNQENKVNQMDHNFTQHVNALNGSLISVSNRVSQNKRDTSSHISSISSSLSRLNTDMADMTGRISDLEANITLIMETRVGFTAGVTSESSSWQGDILVFPHVVTNKGNGYSTSTGKFTAPRAGTYVFFVTGVAWNSNSLSLAIHNDADKVKTVLFSYTHSHYQTGTNLAVLELSQGDLVWVSHVSGHGYYSDSVPTTTFSGFLL